MKSITFSVDLVKSALYHLEFLDEINSLKFNKETIAKAVYRYEKLWIPFYLKNNQQKLYPPIDVSFIWHCHMLCPTSYQDCCQQYDTLIDYKLISEKERKQLQSETKPIWESNLNVSFDYSNLNSVNQEEFSLFQSNFDYNLIEASERQSSFYYQVSLSHFKNKEFLELALIRYKKFLNLKNLNPKAYIVPCYAIDLIWHTHQLHPIAYSLETQKITGSLFPHDDTTNDRTSGSKLEVSFKNTQDLWKQAYNENFFFSGGMFRGNPANDLYYFKSNVNQFNQYCYQYSQFELKDAKLEGIDESLKTSFDIKVDYEFPGSGIIKLLKKFSISNEDTNKNLALKLDDNYNKYQNLVIKFTAKLNENKCKQCLNIFTKCQKTDPMFKFNSEIQIDLSSIKDQEYTMKLNDSFNNEYKLRFNWSIKILTQSEVKIQISKQPFQEINMFNSRNEFKNFGLDLIEYKLDEKGVRAYHQLVVNLGRRLVKVYTLEMLHVLSRKWSSIRIKDIKNDTKLFASSHLIGLEQLPSLAHFSNRKIKQDKNKLSESLEGFIVLDDRYEKAMLVKNLIDQDFAIIKAKWINKRNGIPGVPGDRSKGIRGKQGVPGNMGYLIVSIYLFKSKKTQIIEINNNFVFIIQSNNLKAQVNLKSGLMVFNQLNNKIDELEIESVLASIFSIAILHVMLQPKMAKTTNGTQVKNIDLDQYYMLNTACTTDFFIAYNLAFAVGFDGCVNNGFDGGAGGDGGGGLFLKLIYI
jgi:hypothetical protein